VEADRFFKIATGALVPLDAHLDEYLATLSNEKKSVDMRRSSIRKFATVFPYVSDVARREVQKWANKKMQDGAKLATVQRELSELRGYWRYLQSLSLVPEDALPFDRLSLPRAQKVERAGERKPFAPENVVKLLNAARANKDDQLSDLIELGMWTGARLEELCALKIDRVTKDVLKIEDAKTSAGWREVPVHSKLKPAVKRLLRASKDGFLLSGLTLNKYGDRSNAIGKRFGHLKTDHGYGASHVYHSIRRTVATILENAGVPENVSADILGHEKPRITYGLYSGGSSLAVKREAIEKLKY
jgi:integrase